MACATGFRRLPLTQATKNDGLRLLNPEVAELVPALLVAPFDGQLHGRLLGCGIEQRQGELWRPITTPTFSEKQPTPSEDAVARAGKRRLEGREYEVEDGDIVIIRFTPPRG